MKGRKAIEFRRSVAHKNIILGKGENFIIVQQYHSSKSVVVLKAIFLNVKSTQNKNGCISSSNMQYTCFFTK